MSSDSGQEFISIKQRTQQHADGVYTLTTQGGRTGDSAPFVEFVGVWTRCDDAARGLSNAVRLSDVTRGIEVGCGALHPRVRTA